MPCLSKFFNSDSGMFVSIMPQVSDPSRSKNLFTSTKSLIMIPPTLQPRSWELLNF